MHPTIAYQLVQEHMADLHRQARGETLILASTGAGARAGTGETSPGRWLGSPRAAVRHL